MPFGEYTVDTLKTLPASDAFLQGRLSAVSDTVAWSGGNDTLVSILLSAAVILFILAMRKFARIFPLVSEGMFRWKLLENIEDSVAVSRDRTVVMLALLPAFCFMLSLYGIVSPEFITGLRPGIQCIAVLGFISVMLFLRNFVSIVTKPRKMSYDTAEMLIRLLYDFIIFLTVIMAVTAGVTSLAGIGVMTAKTIMIYESAFVFVLFIVRKIQIAGVFCDNFKTFLYLCSPEILLVSAIAGVSIYL